MNRGTTLSRLATTAIAIVAFVVVACSSTGGGASSSGTPAVPAVCPSACRSAAPCFASTILGLEGGPTKIDQAGCEKQCALEVAGKGFLSLEIATKTFQTVAALEPTGGDKECGSILGLKQFDGPEGQRKVNDLAYLDRCVAAQKAQCPNLDDGKIFGDCFDYQYIYNDTIRKEMESCAITSSNCDGFQLCYSQTRSRVRPKCLPWWGPSGMCK
jgi:hypothetical protein